MYAGEQGMQSKTKRSPTQQDVRTPRNERQCHVCTHPAKLCGKKEKRRFIFNVKMSPPSVLHS